MDEDVKEGLVLGRRALLSFLPYFPQKKKEEHAQSIGPIGVDLQRAARRGLKTHRAETSGAEQPSAKRRCLPYWWPDWGSYLQGGVAVAQDIDATTLAMQKGVLYVADQEQSCVPQWLPGVAHGRKVLGCVAVSGINALSVVGIACENDDSLLVADPDGNRILRIRDGVSSAVGEGAWNLDRPVQVKAHSSGAIFVTDHPHGIARVQRLRNGVTTIVAQWDHDLDNDPTSCLHVTEDETIYTSTELSCP